MMSREIRDGDIYRGNERVSASHCSLDPAARQATLAGCADLRGLRGAVMPKARYIWTGMQVEQWSSLFLASRLPESSSDQLREQTTFVGLDAFKCYAYTLTRTASQHSPFFLN